MIKQLVKLFFIFFSVCVITQIFISYSEARRGCCSWHDGVCGCSCCDGTPLSSKCAPYYPGCGSSQKSLKSSTKTDINEIEQAKKNRLGLILIIIGLAIQYFFVVFVRKNWNIPIEFSFKTLFVITDTKSWPLIDRVAYWLLLLIKLIGLLIIVIGMIVMLI